MNQDPVHVHVSNLNDLVFKTEEQDSGHFSASTFVLPAPGPTQQGPTKVLQLDPLRKRAILSFNGTGQVILAHSMQQADALQANVDELSDDGTVITSPATITVESTAPLWAVGNASGNVTQQSSSAMGAVVATTAGQTIASVAAGNLPSGTYEVYVTTYIDGTPVTATDENNLQLMDGTTVVTQLLQPAPSTGSGIVVPSGPYILNVNGNQAISITTAGVPSGTAKYAAMITAVPLQADAGLSVGVLQERRDGLSS